MLDYSLLKWGMEKDSHTLKGTCLLGAWREPYSLATENQTEIGHNKECNTQ